MHIRAGTVADAQWMADLIASFQPELTDDPSGVGAEQYLASVSASAEAEYLRSPRYVYFVAELERSPAGFLALRDRTHVFHLFVSRIHQRRGVARALWSHALAQVNHVELPRSFTVNSSLGAVPVYAAFGFAPSGTVQSIHGISFLPMRVTLDEHGV